MATRKTKAAAAKRARPKSRNATTKAVEKIDTPPLKKPRARPRKKRQDKRGAPRGKGTVTSNGGHIGNPPFEATAEQRKLVESHAAVGTPQDLIAELIISPATNEPISVDTLTRHFRKELDFGLAKINARIGNLVAKAALSGCKTRQIFWMKTRAGWASTHFLAGPGGGPIQTSQRPALDPNKLSKKELQELERLALKGQPDVPA